MPWRQGFARSTPSLEPFLPSVPAPAVRRAASVIRCRGTCRANTFRRRCSTRSRPSSACSRVAGRSCVLVEDWHWADSGSRAALLRVADVTCSSPLVLIVTSRPEHGHADDWPVTPRRRPPGSAGFCRVRRDHAKPFFGARQVSDALARRLYDRAGGNPFFLEQMCAALLEQQARHRARRRGAGRRRRRGAVAAGHGSGSHPRASRQPGRSRARDREGGVGDWLGVRSRARSPRWCRRTWISGRRIAALEAAGLIQQTSVAPTIGYRFTHALTQEVCYDSLVGHQRKTLHGAIGRALAASTADRMDEAAALLAHHFGRAEDWPAAIRFGRRAAERAIALSQFADALATLDQVLEWVGRLSSGEQERSRRRSAAAAGACVRDAGSARASAADHRRADCAAGARRQLRAAGRGLPPSGRPVDAAQAIRRRRSRAGDGAPDRSGTRRHAPCCAARLRSLGLLRWHEGRHAEALDDHAAGARHRSGVPRRRAVAVDLTNLGNILQGDWRLRRRPGAAGSGARHAGAASATPRNWSTRSTTWRTSIARMGDLDRALDCLVAERRDCPRPSPADSAIVPSHVDGAHPAAAGPHRHRARDLSRRGRSQPPRAPCRRPGAIAADARQRAPRPRPLRRGAAVPAGGRAVVRATGRSRVGSGNVDRASRGSSNGSHLPRPSTRGTSCWRSSASAGIREASWRRARVSRERCARAGAANADRRVRVGAGARGDDWRARARSGDPQHARHSRMGAGRVRRGVAPLRGGARAGPRSGEPPAHEAVILNSLGVSLTKLGRRDEARTVLEESLALSRRDRRSPARSARAGRAGSGVAERPRSHARGRMLRAVSRRAAGASAIAPAKDGCVCAWPRSATRPAMSRRRATALSAAAVGGRRRRRRRACRRVRGSFEPRRPVDLMNQENRRMPRFIIERSVPGLTRDELMAAGRRSVAALAEAARRALDPKLRLRRRGQDLLRVRRAEPRGDSRACAAGGSARRSHLRSRAGDQSHDVTL